MNSVTMGVAVAVVQTVSSQYYHNKNKPALFRCLFLVVCSFNNMLTITHSLLTIEGGQKPRMPVLGVECFDSFSL